MIQHSSQTAQTATVGRFLPETDKIGFLARMARMSPATMVTILLVIAFVVVRLWRLTAVCLDGDEIFGLLLASDTWHGLMASAVYDAIHPPLFYLLLKLWRGIGGESLFWLRLFPAFASVLCLIPFFGLCRDLRIRPLARNLSLAIAAVHPYLIFYSQHVRMYCLLMLGGLCSVWCFERYLQQPARRRLLILSFANLAVVYVHYFGWVIVGLELLYLLWHRRSWRSFTLAMLVNALLFSPWAWAAGRVLLGGAIHERLGWVPHAGIGDFFWFFAELTGCTVLPNWALLTAAIVLAVLSVLLLIYRQKQASGIHWLIFLAVATPIVVFAATPWVSIWGSRHMVFTVWPFLIVLADTLCRLPRIPLAGALVAVAIWAAFAVQFHHHDDSKLPWDRVTLALIDHEHSNSAHIPVYSLDRDTHYMPWFYLECLKGGRLGLFGDHLKGRTDIPQLATKAAQFDVVKVRSVDQVRGQHFWLLTSDPPWKEALSPDQALAGRHCLRGEPVIGRDHFHSVTLLPVQCQEP